MATPSSLELTSIQVAFGGLVVLEDLSLSFGHAPISSLIGPNGAGKTTVFNVMSGIVKPGSGTVKFDGEDLAAKSPIEIARLGIVRKFQVPTVFGGLSVEDNLNVALQAPRDRSDDAASAFTIDEVADLLNLKHRLRILASELSHGERQWLEIGMAFLGSPRFLLLDEPAAGLGPEESTHTAGLIKRISEFCNAVVIEHDMSFVRDLGGDVTVLHQGALLSHGTMDGIENDSAVKDVYLGRDAHA